MRRIYSDEAVEAAHRVIAHALIEQDRIGDPAPLIEIVTRIGDDAIEAWATAPTELLRESWATWATGAWIARGMLEWDRAVMRERLRGWPDRLDEEERIAMEAELERARSTMTHFGNAAPGWAVLRHWARVAGDPIESRRP